MKGEGERVRGVLGEGENPIAGLVLGCLAALR